MIVIIWSVSLGELRPHCRVCTPYPKACCLEGLSSLSCSLPALPFKTSLRDFGLPLLQCTGFG